MKTKNGKAVIPIERYDELTKIEREHNDLVQVKISEEREEHRKEVEKLNERIEQLDGHDTLMQTSMSYDLFARTIHIRFATNNDAVKQLQAIHDVNMKNAQNRISELKNRNLIQRIFNRK